MKIDKKIAVFLYYHMLRIRMIEEKIAQLYAEQQMRCPVHLCIGQEAIAVGVCANLLKKDYLLSNHRSHGHYLAKGGNLKQMLAEIYGKSTGCSKGKGGSMHLVDLTVGILGTTPIVGGIIPVATGVAFGTQMKEKDNLTAVFFGDAATEEGVFFESLNFASLKKLPVLFICENNFFSVYSPLAVRQPKERDNLALVRSLGIKGSKGDGNNVFEVYALAKKAVADIRKGKGPYFLEFDTYRWREHCGPNFDNDLGYRTEEDFLKWKKKCPLDSLEDKLIKGNILSLSRIESFKRNIQAEINRAISFAKNSPYPETEEMLSDVYAK
ncbi:MAG: thiamine pyrophosphate-dependent dehydrogenase E1 component subunit alpha [Candidatus Omnitrophica bacterium]|nr:thiamine pyrophosphate-dependent dehydrogenase E1 component subunit alpha [Candidatus Omnitrophota bacterium]